MKIFFFKKKNIFYFFLADGLARLCHHRHGPCQPSGKRMVFFFLKEIFFFFKDVVGLVFVNGFKFFSLFRIIFGQIPTKQIKTTQNKQNKSNKIRGLPPTKRSFKVISLTVIRRFLYPIPNLSQRDKGIKLTFSPKSHMAFSMVSDPITQGMKNLSGSLSLGGNLFGSVSIKLLNCSSNLDLANSCMEF